MKKMLALAMVSITLLSACTAEINADIQTYDNLEDTNMTYHMPAEDLPHEGTWLIWPHEYTYGAQYPQELEDIWVQMVAALHTDEKVHIIAYDETARREIAQLLAEAAIDMNQVDFVLGKSDDVWARDTGPIFVLDDNNELTIADFGFDGWGEKAPHQNDDRLPQEVGRQTGLPTIDISDFVLEGGAVELDGNGTLMAALSSVVSKNRNRAWSIEQAEAYLSKYLGIRNFIWLEGVTDEDITDAHIDGTARFLNSNTILTVSKADFAKLYETIHMEDYTKLQNATNADGTPYEIVELPLTKDLVAGADCYGSYLNYYIGNQVVLVPVYEDENDAAALAILAEQYPDREIVPIVVNDLFQYGGMIHCVTQQQPQAASSLDPDRT